jgi:hypothetical protein
MNQCSEECVSVYLPEKQWKFIQGKYPQTNQAQVLLDLGFLVTTKHDVEDAKANIDYGLYAPNNALLKSENGVTEGEVDLRAGAENMGPWKLCVRVSGGKLLRPSVIVDITYFSVHYDGDDAPDFDWSSEGETEEPSKDSLASHDQIVDIESGLGRIDRYLTNVTHEQRYLYARTVRHLRTAESTLSRTYWYYTLVYSVICLASFSQIMVIRLMFRKVCCCVFIWVMMVVTAGLT